jgi:hypothetical protein
LREESEMRAPRILFAALAVAPVLLSAEVAFGWSPLDGSQPVWATLPQTYRINQATIPSSIPDGVQSIDYGFGQWMMPGCTSYSAQNLGNTTTGANYNDGLNVLRWVNQNWPSMYGPVNQVIGVTLPVYFNGPIEDADISFNGVGFCWNNTGTGGCVDTKSIATHEIGHSLGLGHSQASGSTMEAAYGGGTAIATIEQDDINGVCTLYPGMGPGSSGVGVASSGASSSSSGGGGMTCMECTQSESSGSCAAEYNACTGSMSCTSFYQCAIGCNGNQTCVQNCANMYPQGAQLYDTFRDCICGACVMECATECGGSGSSSSAVASSSAANSSASAVGVSSSASGAGVGGAGSGNAAGAGGEGGSGSGNTDAEGGCSCSVQSRGVGAGALAFFMALGAAFARQRRSRRR